MFRRQRRVHYLRRQRRRREHGRRPCDAVGFWRLDNDRILLTVLAPPAPFDEKLKDVKGYYAFDIMIAAFNITADGYEGVGMLGEQVRYGKFTRCKA